MKLNSITTKALFISAVTLAMVGCGEDFQGTFTGNNVTVFNPNGSDSACAIDGNSIGSDMEIEIQAQISGETIQLSITQLHKPGQSDSNAARVLSGYTLTAPLQNSVNFDVSHGVFSNSITHGDRTENASVHGEMSPGRDRINNFRWDYEGFSRGSETRCSLGVRATGLIRQ